MSFGIRFYEKAGYSGFCDRPLPVYLVTMPCHRFGGILSLPGPDRTNRRGGPDHEVAMPVTPPFTTTTGSPTSRMSALVPYGVTLLVVGILVTGVSALPPLTQSSTPLENVSPFADAPDNSGPAQFCRANMADVNCACFAQKAQEVLSHPHDPVPGLVYADRWELARGQAGPSC